MKGHVMKLRGDLMRSSKHYELEALSIQVIIEQAAHELKYGDPRVSKSKSDGSRSGGTSGIIVDVMDRRSAFESRTHRWHCLGAMGSVKMLSYRY